MTVLLAGGDPTTRAVHRFLRERRPRRTASGLYVGYVVVVVLALYLLPYGVSVLADLRELDPVLAGRVRSVVPWLVAGVVLAVMGAAVHDGSWRGCVRIEPAAMDWPLTGYPSWPRWAAAGTARAALVAVAAGASSAAVGVLGWVAVHEQPVSWTEVVAATAVGGTVGLAACAVDAATQLELSTRAARICAGLLRGGAAACALASLAALRGWWRPAPTGARWWVVVSCALVLLAVVAVVVAVRALGRLRVSRLREGADRRDGVVAALMSLDTRLAVTIAVEGGAAVIARRPLRPRRAWAAVPWHVVTGYWRRPAASCAGLAWVVAGVLVPALWPAEGPMWHRLVVASLLVQRGASLLSENVRLQTDDVRRSSGLPDPLASVVTASCLTAAGVVCAAATAGLVGLWVVGAPPPGPSVVTAALAPAAAVGAGVTACRGTFPIELLLGAETPFGNTAPVQVAFWLLRVPVTLAGAAVTVGGVVGWSALLAFPAGLAVLGAVVLWLRSRAVALART